MFVHRCGDGFCHEAEYSFGRRPEVVMVSPYKLVSKAGMPIAVENCDPLIFELETGM